MRVVTVKSKTVGGSARRVSMNIHLLALPMVVKELCHQIHMVNLIFIASRPVIHIHTRKERTLGSIRVMNSTIYTPKQINATAISFFQERTKMGRTKANVHLLLTVFRFVVINKKIKNTVILGTNISTIEED